MRTWVTLISLILLGAFSSALAQTSARHEVSVSIPNVLRLQLDSNTSDRATVPVSIRVENGVYRIDPHATELRIFANSNWQLTSHYTPRSSLDAEAKLTWRLDGGAWTRFTSYDQLMLSGGKTGGWQHLLVEYGLEQPLPVDGTYEGVITYTLARP
jgi:hypothetical protein